MSDAAQPPMQPAGTPDEICSRFQQLAASMGLPEFVIAFNVAGSAVEPDVFRYTIWGNKLKVAGLLWSLERAYIDLCASKPMRVQESASEQAKEADSGAGQENKVADA